MSYPNRLVLPRLIVLGDELLVGGLHQSLDILPTDTESRKLVNDDCVNVPDIHEAMHSPNPKDVTIQRQRTEGSDLWILDRTLRKSA